MFKNFKNKWGIDSDFQLLKIFIVFGITGSTAAWISDPLCNYLGISITNFNISLYWLIRLLLITLVYQILLIIIAFIFGELKFFRRFVNKFLRLIGFKI